MRIKRLLALSPEDAAHLFRVSPATVSSWLAALSGDPERTSIGKTVRPQPPLQRYADVVQHTVQTMAVMGFSGYETIAQTLGRVGWRLSRSTVARCLKKPATAPEPTTAVPEPKQRRLRVKYVNHIWMMDFTTVKGLFGLQQFTIAAILDVRSCFPIAARVFDSEPTAEETVAVVEGAIRTHGRPRHFITDQGAQFTGDVFRQRLDAYSIKQRFGAVGKHGSVGIIDRFFRTMKDAMGVRTWKSQVREDLERHLGAFLTHYALYRPHQSLDGATPAEVYFGLEPECQSAVQPPRARDGNPPRVVPSAIAHIDPERRFPIIEKRAA